MCFGTESIACPVCGKSVEQKKTGRAKEYCSDDCRDFMKYKNALERSILKIEFEQGFSNRAKGDIFAMANLIKIQKGNHE